MSRCLVRFCGKPQHEVRSLFEKGCSNRRQGISVCVFICDECVAFCAHIIDDRAANAKEAHKS